MRTPTWAGQYRYVRYDDDGANIYSCNWCDRTINIRDNPDYYNFCPLCGKSWFNQEKCRPSETPRWVWDRYKDKAPHDLRIYVWHDYYYEIVIEERFLWPGGEWTDWHYEMKRSVAFGRLGIWRDMRQALNSLRLQTTYEKRTDLDGNEVEDIQYEYRARLERV